MSALKSLTEEHQAIGELLGALQTYATRLKSGASVAPADLIRFADVLRALVDYRHHEKEEGILLPLLARNGFEWSSGLLFALRHEHGHLRYLLDVLCQAGAKSQADGDALGSREERRQIAEAAIAFVEFKRRHIQKEEDELLPAVERKLSARALEQLSAELAQFDQVTGRNSESARTFQDAAELVQRYSVDSGVVDVTGVQWESAPDTAVHVRHEAANVAFTSFGRSR